MPSTDEHLKTEAMKWKEYNNKHTIRCWVSGIYKVVVYREDTTPEYHAYYVTSFATNWGNFVNHAEHTVPTLEQAQAQCVEHAKDHTPTASTIENARRSECVIASNIKTQAKWASIGRETIGAATHRITPDGDKIPMWHVSKTRVVTRA